MYVYAVPYSTIEPNIIEFIISICCFNAHMFMYYNFYYMNNMYWIKMEEIKNVFQAIKFCVVFSVSQRIVLNFWRGFRKSNVLTRQIWINNLNNDIVRNFEKSIYVFTAFKI